jgi:hypothetical protein
MPPTVHGDINGINFWATAPISPTAQQGRPRGQPKGQPRLERGSMVLKKVFQLKSGAKSGAIEAVFDGVNTAGHPVTSETRTITFYSDPQSRTIDYEIVIDPLEKLTFHDTEEAPPASTLPPG